MRVVNGEEFSRTCLVNALGNGWATVDFSVRWANLIEEELARGVWFDEAAKRTLEELDKDCGVSGAQFDCILGFLGSVWEYGGQLVAVFR